MPAEQQHRPLSISIIAWLHAVAAFYPLYLVAPSFHNPAVTLDSFRSTVLLMLGAIDHPSAAVVMHAKYLIKLGGKTVLYLWISPLLLRIAWGLWRLDGTTRNLAIGVYGVTLAFQARNLVMAGIWHGSSGLSSQAFQPFYIMVAVEVFVVLTLLYGRGVDEAFYRPSVIIPMEENVP